MKGIVFKESLIKSITKDKVYPIVAEDFETYFLYCDDDEVGFVKKYSSNIKKTIDVVKVRYKGEICNLHSMSPKYKNHKRYIIDTEFNDLIPVKEVEIINE